MWETLRIRLRKARTLGIISAVKADKDFLFGTEIVIETNCLPILGMISGCVTPDLEMLRWIAYIKSLNLEVRLSERPTPWPTCCQEQGSRMNLVSFHRTMTSTSISSKQPDYWQKAKTDRPSTLSINITTKGTGCCQLVLEHSDGRYLVD